MSEGREREPRFRDVMGRFPTGVAVVTAVRGDGEPFGLTVNSFTSVSLDPPLVLVCIGVDASSHDALLEAPAFGINVLGAHQSAVADRFAVDPSETRFDGVAWTQGSFGSPRLDGTAAWLECTRHATYPGGDHTILVGQVEVTGEGGDASLLFHRGAYGSVGG